MPKENHWHKPKDTKRWRPATAFCGFCYRELPNYGASCGCGSGKGPIEGTRKGNK